MFTYRIDRDTVTRLSSDRGIDTVTELARRSGVSRWVLYRALRTGRIRPNYAHLVATELGVWPSDLFDTLNQEETNNHGK